MNRMEAKGERIDSITGLKGIACLVVMLNHFAGAFCAKGGRPWEVYPWLTFLFNGTFMLYVFYTLSGFLIAYGLYRKELGKESLGKRLFSRYFRLVIPVFATCLVILVLQHLNLYRAYDQMKNITHSSRSESDAANYYVVLSLKDAIKTALLSPLQSSTQFTFVFWMLPHIYKGFFITMILSLIVRTLKPIPAAVVLLLGGGVFYRMWEFEMMAFIAGVLLAYAYYHSLLRSGFFATRILGVICIVFAVFSGSHWPNSDPANILLSKVLCYLPNYCPLFVMGAAALVVGVFLLRPVGNILATKAGIFLGNLSFGIYLVHDMIQVAAGANVFLMVYSLFGNLLLAQLAAFIISTALIILGAYLIWRYLDPMANTLITKVWDKIRLKNPTEKSVL